MNAVTKTVALACLFSASFNSALAATPPTYFDGVQVGVQVNDIAYDAVRKQILASIPSSAGLGRGNSITHIALDGTLGNSTFVGSEPGVLALSSDSSTLFVGMSGSPLVRQYNVISQTAGAQFGLGSDGFLGAMYAEDIEVLPGSTNSIAVSRKYQGVSPRHAGVAIYDNGVMRSVATPGHTGSNSIAYSDASGTLYGFNNETTEFGFRTMTVGPSGVSTSSVIGSAFGGFGTTIQYANGLIYASNGAVFDPSLGFTIGTFSVPWAYYGLSALTPDVGAGFAYGASGNTLTIFDLNTFVPLSSYTLDSLTGSVNEILLTDNGGLGIRSSSKQLFLLTPVPEPSAWIMMATGILCIVFVTRQRRLVIERSNRMPVPA